MSLQLSVVPHRELHFNASIETPKGLIALPFSVTPLHLSAKVDVRDAAALGYLGLASRTLGDALSNLERYAQTFTEAAQLSLFTNGETAVVQLNPAVQQYRQQAEEIWRWTADPCVSVLHEAEYHPCRGPLPPQSP